MGILHRRHIRIKVMQALYSGIFNDVSPEKGIKNLYNAIEEIYDLYLLLLQSLVEIRTVADQKLEESKNKRLPSDEDLNPNRRFVDHPILVALAGHEALAKMCSERKLDWRQHDFSMIRRSWREMAASARYERYMAMEKSTLEQDKRFLEDVFKEFVANSLPLQEFFEEENIFWSDDLDLACINVLKTIDQMDPEAGNNALRPLYKDEEADRDYARKLYLKSQDHMEESMKRVQVHAKNWELDRIATMDRLMMNMAITEAIEFSEIPVKVTINEYIEIAKYYSTPKSSHFINGVLDKVIRELKDEGKIRKRGRGLIDKSTTE